jgi:nucleoside-diphosphate-sugar epimerase
MDPVLVTGTSGLVGYQVALRLHEAGTDVLGLDIRPAPDGVRFPHIVADAGSLDAVARAMAGRPNVVHAGAISGPMLLPDNPHGIAQANLGASMAVFEAARRVGVRRLVWLSSIAVYGDQPTLDPVTESAAQNPQSFYGQTKVAGEALLRGYVVHYGLSAVALRLSSVFGPRRQTACGLRAIIECGLQGRTATVAAAGSSYRQYVHVEDAARAVLCALTAGQPPGFVYNITGGSYETDADLARMMTEYLPTLSIAYGPAAWNEGHLGPLVIEAAERDLAYRPQIPLRQGLAELCRHLGGPSLATTASEGAGR